MSQEVYPHSDATRKMRLRGKPTEGTQEDANDQENALESDEDDLYPGSSVPEMITRVPLKYRARDFTDPSLVQEGLNPEIPAFVPRSSTDVSAKPGHDLQSEVSLANSDANDAVMQPVPQSGTLDHVIINMPDFSEMHVSPITDSIDHVATDADIVGAGDAESFGLRRLTRDRRPPRKLTYDELGEPLIMAISSFFQALGVAFSEANLLHTDTVIPGMPAETHRVKRGRL